MSEIQEVVEARQALAAEHANHVEARDEIARLEGRARALDAKISAALAPHDVKLALALVLQARSLDAWEVYDDGRRNSASRYRVTRDGRQDWHTNTAWMRKMVQPDVTAATSRLPERYRRSTVLKWTLDVTRWVVKGTTDGRHVFTDLALSATTEDAMAAADAKLTEWGWLLVDGPEVAP